MSKALIPMKVALVYDRVNKWGGAERVLLALHDIFPDAQLYTSVYSIEAAAWAKVFPQVIPSFLNALPFAKSNHEKLPVLMPLAFESFDLSEYDLVISVTSESAKGIITSPKTRHICICLTPTRYLWSGYDDYFDNWLLRRIFKPFVNYLRKWDRVASHRPDKMVAISSEVQDRIQKYYGIDTEIIFPPVDFTIHTNTTEQERNGYLIVSRLVKYKQVNIAIEAFNRLGMPLTIVGVGREMNELKKLSGSNINFIGDISDTKLSVQYVSHKALIMPQFEDFGLVSVEAQLHGTPVIAFGKGGALDTVINKETGLLFEHQTAEDVIKAVRDFEKMTFDSNKIKNNAKRFTKENFKKSLLKLVI